MVWNLLNYKIFTQLEPWIDSEEADQEYKNWTVVPLRYLQLRRDVLHVKILLRNNF